MRHRGEVMAEPEFKSPEIPVGPLIAAGVVGAGLPMLFPSGLLAFGGLATGFVLPVLAVTGVAAGIYLYRSFMEAGERDKQAPMDTSLSGGESLLMQRGQNMPPPGTEKEWQRSEEMRKNSQEAIKR
jgi:hypothetical protein